MQLFARARLYGEAVRLLDEFLGEEVRDQVMERFAVLAPALQRRRLKDPWEVIARSALDVGVPEGAVGALGVLYLGRTGQRQRLDSAAATLTEEARTYLREWQVLDELMRGNGTLKL